MTRVACLQAVKTCLICLHGWHITIGHSYWGLDRSFNLCCLIQDMHNISFPPISLPCLAAWLIFFWPRLYSSQPATPPKLWPRQAVHTPAQIQWKAIRVRCRPLEKKKKGFKAQWCRCCVVSERALRKSVVTDSFWVSLCHLFCSNGGVWLFVLPKFVN